MRAKIPQPVMSRLESGQRHVVTTGGSPGVRRHYGDI